MVDYSLPLLMRTPALSEHLRAGKQIGCEGFELQLKDEFLIRETGEYRSVSDAFKDIDALCKYKIVAVSAPERCNGSTALELICNKGADAIFYNTCEFANEIGSRLHKVITVVFYTEVGYSAICDKGGILSRLTEYFITALRAYPNIRIGIKNVAVLKEIDDGAIEFRNNFGFDNVRLALKLREVTASERIGTVLDVGSALLSDQYITILFSMLRDGVYPDFTLEKYFRANRELCFLVQLSDNVNSGLVRRKRFIRFDEYNSNKCRGVLALYTENGYTCPITIAVEDFDYRTREGFVKTRDTVRRL